MKRETINLSAIIAAAALFLSVSGWAVRTTVSEMLLKQKVEFLEDQRTVLRNNLRACGEAASMSVVLDPDVEGSEPIVPFLDNFTVTGQLPNVYYERSALELEEVPDDIEGESHEDLTEDNSPQ